MNLESLRNLDKKYAQTIADYLLNRIESDELLKSKLEETNKTLKGCVEYIKTEAKKEAEDGVAMIEDSQVYDWAVHYFLEDNLKMEPKAHDDKKVNTPQPISKPSASHPQVKNEEKIKDNVKPKKDIKKKLYEQISLFD